MALLVLPLRFCVICVTFLVLNTESVDLVIHSLYGRSISCYPVVCREGFQASFCKLNGTKDYCHICPYGSKQDKVVDSRTVYATEDIPKCSRIDIACLTPETKPIVENGKIVRCECDLSEGYVGKDPLCIKVESCPPGRELTNTNSQCKPCPLGSYKNTTGYDFCQPWTRCEILGRETLKEGNGIADTVCGKLLPTTKIESSSDRTTTSFTVSLRCGTGDCLSRSEQTDSKDFIDRKQQLQNMTKNDHLEDCTGQSQSTLFAFTIIIIICMLLTIVGMTLGFMFINRKLNGRHMKGHCLPGKMEEDEEKMSYKPGIQEVNETSKHAEKGSVMEKAILIDVHELPDAKTSTSIPDQEQPATIYPLINEEPAEPTAPELSMQENLQPVIHGQPSCLTCDADCKPNIYVPKGNYDKQWALIKS